MSFSLITTYFTRLSHFARQCPTQLFTKSSLVRTIHSQITKSNDFNNVNERTETEITESKKDVLRRVNEDQIHSPSRIFAVVQICGKQFKVTTDDVIIVEGYWPPNAGDKISLDKILCAGGENFSLIGTPLIEPSLVHVHATIIEKNLSHTKTFFRKKRRKQYMRINFYRNERTLLRINNIAISKLNDKIDS